MSSGEKKTAAILVVVLVAMVGVYFATGSKFQKPTLGPLPTGMPGGRAASAAGDAACAAPGAGGGAAAKTQELGKTGAKVEIVAVIPVAHGCHRTTEGELKKAYEAHPNDIHLTIVDLMGPDAPKYRDKVGVGWTAVAINGKTEFEVNGRKVQLQRAEGQSYQPSDLIPIIEAELKKT